MTSARPPSLSRRFAASLVPVLVVAFALLAPGVAFADDDAFTRALAKGPLFGAGAALLGGLLTAATPCVYPMIAITVSVFGAKQAKSRAQAMMLSTAFVLGIICLFTPMLVGAALTGSLFGSVLQNKWVLVGIAAVFMAMGLSMFGLFDIALPESVNQRLATIGGGGSYFGAFLLGLVCGLVAAPCTGPVLTGILLWIGKTKDVLVGSAAGLAFSIGLGIPFWLVGTFAVSLPKGGKWMLGVKSLFGIVMFVVALHYLKPAFPILAAVARPDTTFMVAMGALAVVGLALGAVHRGWDEGGKLDRPRKGLAVAMVIGGLFLGYAGYEKPKEVAAAAPTDATGAPKKLLRWETNEAAAVARAQAEKRPLIVDFTADWCTACKELYKHTLSDPRVMEKAADFVAVKIDATNEDDPQVDAVKGKYGVVGLPTVVVFDSSGKERHRFNEFVPAEKFLAAIETVQ